MSNAEKMFAEIGYKKSVNEDNDIIYTNEVNLGNNFILSKEEIMFFRDKAEGETRHSYVINSQGTNFIRKHCESGKTYLEKQNPKYDVVYIYPQLQDAINEQLKELNEE